MNKKTYLGFEFIWWTGVVENRMDPLNLGRLQVRIFGWHTENLDLIPSEDLPWAVPLRNTRVDETPREGEYVMGFFFDGQSGQVPYYLGVFPGIPIETPNQGEGFSDQRTEIDLSGAPQPFGDVAELYPSRLGEPTTSRLFRNEGVDKTIIGRENTDAVESVPSASGASWSQPQSSYNTKPPYNRVLETESGHVFELDDTKDAERIHLAHRTGTFFEVGPNGTKVTKVVGNNYEIIVGTDYVVIQGECNVTINGNSNVLVQQNAIIKVNGKADMTVTGALKATAGSFDFTGDFTLDGALNVSKKATFNDELSVSKNVTAAADVTVAGITKTGGINLNTHTHSTSSPGAPTGPPLP